MTAQELKYQINLALLENSYRGNETNCPYSDEEYLQNLNDMLVQLYVDMLNKDMTSFKNLKRNVSDIVVTRTVGVRGYQGMYKLPDDLLQLKQVLISLDGNCWIEANFTTKNLGFDYNCNDCPCKKAQCGIDLRKINDYLEIRPIPKLPVKKGLVVYYEAYPEKVMDIKGEIPLKPVDILLLKAKIIDYQFAVKADKHSNAKVQRMFNQYNNNKRGFDKINGLQTKPMITRNHPKRFI